MPRLSSHGGGCCGARHISGFGGSAQQDRTNPEKLENAVSQAPNGRMLEIILNGNQVRHLPLTLQKMADLGFVLVGRYKNSNHNSDNYVFHRCDRRHRMDRTDWWPGQVIDATMRGDLERMNNVFRPAPVPMQPVRRYQEHLIGDVVRVNSPTSRRNGREFTIVGFQHTGYYGGRVAVMEDEGRRFKIALANIVRVHPVPRVAPPVPERPVLEPQIHVVG